MIQKFIKAVGFERTAKVRQSYQPFLVSSCVVDPIFEDVGLDKVHPIAQEF